MNHKLLLPKNVEREFISEFIGENGKKFQIVKASVEDIDVIEEVNVNQYLKYNPWTENIDFSTSLPENDAKYREQQLGYIKDGLYLLVTDGTHLCGVVQCSIEALKEDAEKFRGFKKDYGEELKKYESSSECYKNMTMFLVELEKVLPFHIPVGKYFEIGRLTVAKEFMGNGIAKILWREAMKLAKLKGLCYIISDCTAKASTHIAEKNGMPTVFAFPLDRMIINCVQIWPSQLSDGSTSINLVVGDLNKIELG